MDEGTRSLGTRLATAFWLQYNIIFLFGCASFALALASLTPLRLGALVEVAWLALAATLPGVGRWVTEQSLSDEVRKTNDGFPPELHERVRAVRETAASIVQSARKARDIEPAELGAIVERIDAVQHAFVRLAHAGQRVSGFLSSLPTADIEAEMKRVSDSLVGEKDLVVKLGLKQSLGLLQRRVRERDRVVNALRATDVQMRTIETSFTYIRSVLANTSSPRDCAAEIESLAMQIAACEALETEAGSVLAEAGGGVLAAPAMRS